MFDITRDAQHSPFHAGEQQVQAHFGVRDVENWAKNAIRNYMPEQHRNFFKDLPFLVVAARDSQGRPWATVLDGPDGFVRSPSPQDLTIAAEPKAGDALEGALTNGADIGILGIELATRRRNRVNGRIEGAGAVSKFRVDQSFGNCPQYIRERQWHRVEDEGPSWSQRSTRLSQAQTAWIRNADTLFIASGFRGEDQHRSYGMDASHRGGDKGFIQVLDDRHIRFPDYAGNNFYNTIGNLASDGRGGYLFIDFATGALLQITGKAILDWDCPAVAEMPGAKLLVTLEIEEINEVHKAINLRWDEDADSVRSLRLVARAKESDEVTSFVFEARDGGALSGFEAGQFLPIVLDIPGEEAPVERTYSLSSAPDDPLYRITVKREDRGLASRFLHDHLPSGALINGRRPAGDFVAPQGNGQLVLISAGVGVTPMVSILRDVVSQGGTRPILFVHAARNGAHHTLGAEVASLSKRSDHVQTHVVYSRARPQDRLGVDYDSQGPVSGDLITGLNPDPDAHYLICGPVKFMAAIQEGLKENGVPMDQIHTESFGPAG